MEVSSATDVQDQYLTLLVSQLQNQDPLEPVSQENFITQVAQFQSLSGIEELNLSFEKMVTLQSDLLQLQEATLGNALVGQTVEFNDATSAAGVEQGTIEGFEFGEEGLRLLVDDRAVNVSQIRSIRDTPGAIQ